MSGVDSFHAGRASGLLSNDPKLIDLAFDPGGRVLASRG